MAASRTRLWRSVAYWFAGLMLFWVAANLAGTIRPMGLKPIRWTGFPFIVAVWGWGVDEGFRWPALAANVAIALGSSTLLAWWLAAYRFKRR